MKYVGGPKDGLTVTASPVDAPPHRYEIARLAEEHGDDGLEQFFYIYRPVLNYYYRESI